MAHIMTTKELSQYLKLHQITISKYAAQGKIPAIRIDRILPLSDAVKAHEVLERQEHIGKIVLVP